SGRILPLRTCCRLRLTCAFPPPMVFLCSRVTQPTGLGTVAQLTDPDKRLRFGSGRMVRKGSTAVHPVSGRRLSAVGGNRTVAAAHQGGWVAPTAAIRRAANNEGPWDHPVTTLV